MIKLLLGLKTTPDVHAMDFSVHHIILVHIMDFSATFDTVDHDSLGILMRLEVLFGMCGTLLKWMQSYVADLAEAVVVSQSKSSIVTTSCGVHPGSMFRPLIFIIYTKNINTIIRRHGL